jgi:ribosomal protein L21
MADVTADVVRQDRGEKIVVFKYRPSAQPRHKAIGQI